MDTFGIVAPPDYMQFSNRCSGHRVVVAAFLENCHLRFSKQRLTQEDKIPPQLPKARQIENAMQQARGIGRDKFCRLPFPEA